MCYILYLYIYTCYIYIYIIIYYYLLLLLYSFSLIAWFTCSIRQVCSVGEASTVVAAKRRAPEGMAQHINLATFGTEEKLIPRITGE